jgi:hypothetical protein
MMLVLALAGCPQKLDEKAATGDPVDAGPALDTPPIELPGGGTTQNPCDRTTAQAQDILRRYCVLCHGGQTPEANQGHPHFDFILDFKRLTMTRSENAKDPRDLSMGMVFVVPGDPEDSRVYQRIADNEMPPTGGADPLPRPNFSEISVLYTWIMSCVSP